MLSKQDLKVPCEQCEHPEQKGVHTCGCSECGETKSIRPRVNGGCHVCIARENLIENMKSDDPGPTMRDQFALAALSGIIARSDIDLQKSGGETPGHLANLAYIMASAMLAERDKPKA